MDVRLVYLFIYFSLWPFCMIPLPYFHALLVFAFINPSPFFRDLNCYKKRPNALPSPATPSLPVISRLGSGVGALLSCYARCHAVIGRIFLRCLPGHRVATLTSHWEQPEGMGMGGGGWGSTKRPVPAESKATCCTRSESL